MVDGPAGQANVEGGCNVPPKAGGAIIDLASTAGPAHPWGGKERRHGILLSEWNDEQFN
jgi:hypothetical protein